MRTFRGKSRSVLIILLTLWSAFQLWFSTAGAMDAMSLRVWHSIFLLSFTFVYYGFTKTASSAPLKLYDCIPVLLTVFAYGWMLYRYPQLAVHGGQLNRVDYLAGSIGLLLLLEAARRVCPGLFKLALAFLLYCFMGRFIPGALGHGGFSFTRVLRHLFWGSQGIFGTGLGVSATYIFIFMLFGAFLQASGFSRFLNDLSLALVGKSVGGPAKVSVLSSALLGMMNGSAVANVATTGAITIPLMKGSGYSAEFSGAVEAASSTGGQFTPPVLGAVGFVMAEYLGVPYKTVIVATIVPSFLYYLCLILSVHFEAKRLGLKGISTEALPNVLDVLKHDGHLLIPLIVLIVLLVLGFTPLFSAVCATCAVILSSLLRRHTRMNFRTILLAAASGAKSALSVGIPCMLIGIIIGTVSLTGLGLTVSSLLMKLAKGGSLLLTGLCAALLCTMLGMGVPGVAAYVIVASMAAPVLIDAGAPALNAHLFCLFYACLSNITPPVALSAYVASGISGGDAHKTGWLAVRLGLMGFLLPLFFLSSEGLLLQSSFWADNILPVLTAVLGCILLSAALFARTKEDSRLFFRLLYGASALCLLHPALWTDILALFFLLPVLWLNRKRS